VTVRPTHPKEESACGKKKGVEGDPDHLLGKVRGTIEEITWNYTLLFCWGTGKIME